MGTTIRYGAGVYGTAHVYGTATVDRALTFGLTVDWDNDGSFDGTNEFTNMLAFSTRRGREFVFTGTGEGFEHVDIGSVEIELLDQSRRYDPYNPNSELAGQLYGNQKLKLTVKDESTGTIYNVFTGYIQDVRPEYGEVQRAKIYAEDGLRILQNKSVRSSGVQTSVQYDDQISAALTAAGWMDATDIDTTVSDTMTYHWFRGNSARKEINDLADAAFGTFFVEADGTAKFISRVISDNKVLDLTDADIDYYYGVQAPAPRDVIRNVVTVYARARKEQAGVEIWRLTDIPQLVSGTNSPIWANFSYQNEEAPALSVTTPVATTDYTANNNADGSGTDRTSDLSLSLSTFATAAKITPTLTGAAAYLTLLKLRGTVIAADKYTFAQVSDDDSILTYGEREFLVKSDWLQSVNGAQEQAEVVLAKFANPKVFPRVKIRRASIGKQFTADLFSLVGVSFETRGVVGEFRIGHIESNWNKSEDDVIDTVMYFEPNLSVASSGDWTFPTTFPTVFPTP